MQFAGCSPRNHRGQSLRLRFLRNDGQLTYPHAAARLVIMNSARTSGVVALILLTGVAIWGSTFHFLENGTNIAGESLSPADRNEQVLLDGLADGRILYFRIEDYRNKPDNSRHQRPSASSDHRELVVTRHG